MKPTKIRVKPARPGMNLRHPVSGLLPDDGKRWVDDSFTRRRIADGGITIVADDDSEEAQPAAAPVQAAAPAAAPLAPKPVALVAPAAAKPASAEK